MKLFTSKIYITIFIAILPLVVLAQEKKQMRIIRRIDTINAQIKDSIRQRSTPEKDLIDVAGSILKKRKAPAIKQDTITSKPIFTAVPAVGYTLQSKLVATIAGNVVFRSKPENKISTITASAAYSQRKQFTLPIESNIWTKGNKFNLIGDFRFYKYPQSTFGLGSSSNVQSEQEMDYSYLRLYEIILKQLTGNFFAGVGYILDYHWNVSGNANSVLSSNDFLKYGAETHTVSAGFTANAVYDHRNNPINPSHGFYSSLQYRNNQKALGSTRNWQSLILDVRKYFVFPGKTENVLAFWSYNWLILKGKAPYLDLPSNGWDSYTTTGRGYIQGRFRGAQMVYAETEYRFGITGNGLFGGVVFLNAESFSAEQGSRLQKIQPGYGAGLRIKLNKISKTNISLDYGFGRQGSRGLFVNVGEMF